LVVKCVSMISGLNQKQPGFYYHDVKKYLADYRLQNIQKDTVQPTRYMVGTVKSALLLLVKITACFRLN